MNYLVYSVRDSKVNTFFPPQFRATEAEAIRDMHALVNDPQSLPGKYPSDYSLWHVGGFDSSTGILETRIPALVINCDQLVQKQLS